MPKSLLSEFSLSIDINTFFQYYWRDTVFYEEFMRDRLEDLKISIGPWKDSKGASSSGNGGIDKDSISSSTFSSLSAASASISRDICSFHPAKVSFPGLPSHAESYKNQTLSFISNETEKTLKVIERNSFKGIPYSDYFNVNTEWLVDSKNNNPNECSIRIYIEIEFLQWTWLQGTIESNTRAELVDVFEKWNAFALERLPKLQNSFGERNTSERSGKVKENLSENDSISNLINLVSGKVIKQKSISRSSSVDTTKRDGGSVIENINMNASDEENETDSIYGSDDELLFYDCEDASFSRTKSGSSLNLSFNNNSKNTFINYNYDISGGDLSPNSRSSITINNNLSDSPRILNRSSSTRDIAITVVETILVLVQFLHWKIDNFYTYDLKQMFDVKPIDVIRRISYSFIPGYHGSVLADPDLYGPTIAVFLFPQCVLFVMDAIHHGCSQSAVLGNAVVMSLYMWFLLSMFYWLLSLMIASTKIKFKHCLSLTGYSFYSWNLALLISKPLEMYVTVIPTTLPIVLFGLPSAVAQGFMFWELAPKSSIQFQPRSLPVAMQQFANSHARMFQKILAFIPKILAFIVITGTHYQFLWYVMRVFLPGRTQQCELSALIQPDRYADILTQKELREFALRLINGKNPM